MNFLLVAGLEDAVGGRGDSITNADAERVLLRVKQKLEGLEGGIAIVTQTVAIVGISLIPMVLSRVIKQVPMSLPAYFSAP